MISIINVTQMTDRSVVAARPLGFSLPVSGLSGVPAMGSGLGGVRIERQTKALAVAATAQAQAYAFADTNGAGNRTKNGQKKQHHPMWDLRRFEPWSDPV
ncbi:hypothetical protein [Actinacidiphila oryziradicis]|uniref:Uncharacterized protein n=1 Tax=Actinacidiphila oryziradicis TaxID=2571141 RepID=A0A4U0SL18_9ACTN|nr:hypothetical protein [Actinacidiphila oryziradicis]TKA10580.1 hypothetical protein FCI23_16520 [Actinacidiphila oryziradicis]